MPITTYPTLDGKHVLLSIKPPFFKANYDITVFLTLDNENILLLIKSPFLQANYNFFSPGQQACTTSNKTTTSSIQFNFLTLDNNHVLSLLLIKPAFLPANYNCSHLKQQTCTISNKTTNSSSQLYFFSPETTSMYYF